LEARRDRPGFHLLPNLPQADYFSLLRHCALLIGNSSSGMIESSSFRIPVINLGIRQEGRERGENVIDAPHESAAIRAAIADALSPAFQATLPTLVNPYGGGSTGMQIAAILSSVELGKELIQKKLNSR
jgi:GDP/UDP-N,N'-diacetylbacillosamine 2-epimerase (hydrolysing)